jgi:transposase
MRIIGCDLHARQQTLAMLDTTTGEVVNLTLMHEGDKVREFYSELPRPALVGIEATGSMQWFLNLMEELGIECRVGHPAQIRAAEPRKQKHDRRDADLILKLLAENRFPAIWLPSKELLDLRALLLHRHQWVRMRVRMQNGLQAIALANGLRRGPALWSDDGQAKIAFLPLLPHAAYRRSALQAMYKNMQSEIENLTRRVAEQAGNRCGARLLMTHPGVGPVTALATEVFLGDPQRFTDSKTLASYVGIIPREYSSGEHQRLGGVTKQGSPLLRFLWGEAGAHAARRDPELKRFYRRKLVQKGLGKARVAVARKLGIRLWIMLRDEIDYQEFCRRGQLQQKTVRPVVGMPETGNGAKSHRQSDEATHLPGSRIAGRSNISSWSTNDRRDGWWATLK